MEHRCEKHDTIFKNIYIWHVFGCTLILTLDLLDRISLGFFLFFCHQNICYLCGYVVGEAWVFCAAADPVVFHPILGERVDPLAPGEREDQDEGAEDGEGAVHDHDAGAANHGAGRREIS